VIRAFVDHGCAPSTRQLQEILRVDSETIVRALRELEQQHGLVLHPHTPEVWVAHPFSTAPTPFAVWQKDRTWWGNCAWCSLGIAALLGGNGVIIKSSFGAEGTPVTVHVDQHAIREPLLVHFPIPMARAWDNVHFTCANMLLFASEADVDQWSGRHALPRGDVQPIQAVYDFARVWYGKHLSEDWTKWTAREAREIFERFGFRGSTWDLATSAERF
jgi:hypothetical protein